MIALTLAEAAAAMGGTVVGLAPGEDVVLAAASVTSLIIDSRAAAPGALFFALQGETADGHDYVPGALAGGALAAVVSREIGGPGVLVDDVLRALGALGTHIRSLLDESVVVVGVTGSVGKTTAKDYIASVLELRGPTVAPANSFNNEIGLPLTISRVDEATANLVLEMGARGKGHINELCAIGQPSIGLVLNVGSAHLGEFGSREGIAVAKRELVESLPASGVAVLNADDPFVSDMRAHTAARVVTFGSGSGSDGVAPADVSAADVQLTAGRVSFTLVIGTERHRISLAAVGRQQLPNALAAAAVAHAVGMDAATIAQGLRLATARSHWRMEMHERDDGVTVVNDAYNASPEAVRAAIESLVELGGGTRRTIMVLGRMAELGDESERIHQEIGVHLGASPVSRVLVVGESARPLFQGAMSSNSREGADAIELVADITAAAARLEEILEPGDVVLVKAARAEAFERLATMLTGVST